jgi:integrase
MKLTQDRIEDLECLAGKKDMLVFDTGKGSQRGLGVRVSAGGSKSYLVQYRHTGQKRRVPIGSCTAIKLVEARRAALAIMGDVSKGRDPAADRKAAALEAKRKAAHEALTLAALIEQWAALHLAEKRGRYASEAVRALRHAFAKQVSAPAADLDRPAVVRMLDRLAKDRHTAMASRTAAYGRACYQWAVKRGSLTVNPFANVPVAAVAKRERVLTDDELRSIWRASAGAGAFNAIVRILILTGQRRDEVAAMAWDELANDLSTWTVPANRAKNGAAHLVPLSAQAQAIVREAAHIEGSPLVYPGLKGPFNGFSKAKAALDKACGVTDWRLHDLRRTLATGLQRLGTRLEVTEAVLNHVAGSRAGIVGVYQRHEWKDEKRAALNAWGAHVAAIVERREASGNVTAFPARGR